MSTHRPLLNESIEFTNVTSTVGVVVTTAPEVVDDGAPTEDDMLLATIIVFAAAFPSLLVNGVFGLYSLRCPTINRQLCLLNISLAVCDVGALAVFAFWTAPMTIRIDLAHISEGFIGAKVGQFAMLCWFGDLYMCLGIAVNRYIAVTKPTKYKIIFSDTNTKRMIAFLWFLAAAMTAVYFIPGCSITYSPAWFSWAYADSPCGRTFSTFIQDQVYTVSMFCIILLVNLMTLRHIRKMTAKVSSVSDEETKRRNNMELRFFLQALFNMLFFNYCTFSFTILSVRGSTPWWYFWTTIIPWLMSHASNGFLALALIPDFRKRFLATFLCRKINWNEGTVTMVKGASQAQ